MKEYQYTHRVTKIMHDDRLSFNEMRSQLEPFILSYIFSSYKCFLYMNGANPIYLTGSELNKKFGKLYKAHFDVIEWGRVDDFNLPKPFNERFKYYPDRQIIHVVITFSKRPCNIKEQLLRTTYRLELYFSVKKFSKTMK